MTKDAVDEIAQGRVWAGKDALKIGLCDEKGTLLEAIGYIADKAGLKDYRIAVYPEKKSMLKGLKDGDKPKKDDPLVRIKSSLTPGFKAMAIMPYISLDTVKFDK